MSKFQQFQQMQQMQQQQEFQRQQQMQQMQEIQMKEAFGILNLINGACFEKCVTDLSTNQFTGKEEACVKQCAAKYVKHSQRIAQQFQKKASDGSLGF